MNREKRTEIFSRLRAENPNPTTELNYSTPFELLIAISSPVESYACDALTESNVGVRASMHVCLF